MKKAELELLGIGRFFNRFASEGRANMPAWRRLNYRQKNRTGEFFYTTSYCPGVGFGARWQAINAARAAMAEIAVKESAEASARLAS